MKKGKLRITAIMLTVVMLLGTVGCKVTDQPEATAPAETTAPAEMAAETTENTVPADPTEKSVISVYTGRDQAMIDLVTLEFEKQYPQYELQVTSMGAQEVLERVRAESVNPQADFWWGGTQSAFEQAAEEDLLQPYKLSVADQIDPAYKDPNDLWCGEILIPEVIMYNADVLTAETAPQDWDALLDPVWDDEIIIRNVLPSGTMRTIYCSMIYKEGGSDPTNGYAWLEKLDANTKSYVENPSALYLALARQEGTVSLWNLQDILIQKEVNNQPFGYIWPASGAPILTDGVGIVKNCKNPEGAKVFYEFLFQENIKLLLAEQAYQIPAQSNVPKEKMPAWYQELPMTELDVDWAVLGEHEMEWMEYWDQNIKGSN